MPRGARGRGSRQGRHEVIEVLGQRRFEVHFRKTPRMRETKLPGMQHLTGKIFRQLRRVNFVADHRVTEMMQVHADLMSASTMQDALDQTHLSAGAQHFVFGDR